VAELAPTGSWRGRFDSPVLVGIGAGCVAAVFEAARALVAGHGSVAAFTLVGRDHAVPGRVPRGIPIIAGQGYDSEFYYRLALDPADFARRAFGIRLDSAERFGRILYPALAWLLAGGHPALVPWSLVAVNVLCLGVIAALGAMLARRNGLHAVWGLAVASFAGFLWSLGRDLTELVAAAGLLAGLVAIRAGRRVLAGLALACAALGRETELLAAGCVAAADLLVVVFRGVDAGSWFGRVARRVGMPDRTVGWPVWLLPIAVYTGWQLTVVAYTGQSPLLSSGSANLALPFTGVLKGLEHYAAAWPSVPATLWFGELVVLGVVAGTAIWSWRSMTATPGADPVGGVLRAGTTASGDAVAGTAVAGTAVAGGAVVGTATGRAQLGTGSGGMMSVGVPLHERLLWIGAVVLVLCLARGIWLGNVGFRSFDDVFLMSWVLILGTRRHPVWLAAIVAGTWLVVAVQLVRFL